MAQLKKSTIFLGVAVLAMLGAAVKFFIPSKEDRMNQSAGNTSDMKTDSSTVDGSAETSVEDTKSVSVKSTYRNPAGDDEVGFTLTVNAEGVIVEAKTDVLATHDVSKKRQEAFAEGLGAVVVGKKLADLSEIDRVGGSSLTTNAFNAALDQLKSQL